jgi:hypothetical protein
MVSQKYYGAAKLGRIHITSPWGETAHVTGSIGHVAIMFMVLISSGSQETGSRGITSFLTRTRTGSKPASHQTHPGNAWIFLCRWRAVSGGNSHRNRFRSADQQRSLGVLIPVLLPQSLRCTQASLSRWYLISAFWQRRSSGRYSGTISPKAIPLPNEDQPPYRGSLIIAI